MKNIPFFSDMFQYNQGNPYHSLPLCQHTYMVYAHLTENYVGEDLFLLQSAAAFHDTGKPFCRVFKKLKGYHSYYGHKYVSTHIACHFLMELGFE
ncbi:poly(A) polymerase [Bacillus sp. AF56]